MSESTNRPVPPDQEARDRILHELNQSILVEAGAGSGKTTAMVGRMVELVATGAARIDQIAAVTFTRKAGGELRERFEEALDAELRKASGHPRDSDTDRLERIRGAMAGTSSGFIGTIHAFCAELLREQPLRAGIPPGFRIVNDRAERELWDEAWDGLLDQLHSSRRNEAGQATAEPGNGRTDLASRLDSVGLDPRDLRGAAEELIRSPGAAFPAEERPIPDAEGVSAVRSELSALLDRTLSILPADPPRGGWDALQAVVVELEYARTGGAWNSTSGFFESLTTALFRSVSVTQKCWGGGDAGKMAKELENAWMELRAEGSAAVALMDSWHAHRYPLVIEFAREAESRFRQHRLSRGALTQDDLLTYTLRLLRSSSEARASLRERFTHILVDEFQDTDPLQTEIVFLLTSDGPPQGGWASLVPRPGALFVVGDPKQSIYRFRRADIQLYRQVRERFSEWGRVLSLQANFRSDQCFEDLVDRVFRPLFPEDPNDEHAPFAPLLTLPDRPEGAILNHHIEVEGSRGAAKSWHGPDARSIASWIADRVERGEREPGDFLILAERKAPLSAYGAALERRGVPVEVSGSAFEAEVEIDELILVLSALHDPADPVRTLAVLEGPFFGCDGQSLWDHRQAGGSFDLRTPEPGAAVVSEALRRLGEWRRIVRVLPVDVAVRSIVRDIGLIPYLASGGEGSTELGSLLLGLEELSTTLGARAATLRDAIDTLEDIRRMEVETPLHPGDPSVVRIMNLHKAKGLEAPVVVLAYPKPLNRRGDPGAHYRRNPEGRPEGYFVATPRFRTHPIAKPLDWKRWADAEDRFRKAERTRLLYVAATRAREELVVSRAEHRAEDSPWAIFHEALDDPERSGEVEVPDDRPESPLRATPFHDLGEVRERVAAAASRIESAKRTSYRRAVPSSDEEREGDPPSVGADRGIPGRDVSGQGVRVAVATDPASVSTRSEEVGGVEWGDRVHGLLTRLGANARRGCEEAIEHTLRESFLDPGADPRRRIADEPDVQPPPGSTELDHLRDELRRVWTSTIWAESLESEEVHRERSFSILEKALDEDGVPTVTSGRIDLVYRRDGSWTVADFKTDRGGASRLTDSRESAYRAQVDRYADVWAALTGESVSRRALVFTATGDVMEW